MNYKKRLLGPTNNNKYYKHISASGLNSCIPIRNGSVLPNCVGYAWGRWYEMLGKKPKLSRGNATNWYSYKDGYKRGKTPKLGAVICWSGNRYGHVAIVEEIYPNGDIRTSTSNYGGSRFYLSRFTKASNYYLGRGYTFQGFIYTPINFTDNVMQTNTSSIDKRNAELNRKYPLIKENWRFNVGVNRLNIRTEPSTNAKVVAQYRKGDVIRYDGYIKINGYVWISYIANSGNRRYVATGNINRKGYNDLAFGNFK